MAVQRTISKGVHTHAQLHNREHSITSGQDHTFPGGTSTFLRADGTFAAPSGNATSLQGRPVSAVQPNSGQVMKWNGSEWSPAVDLTGDGSPGGAVTSVNGQTGDVSLGSADVSADPVGSAAAAQANAVQRSNHTGTQTISTVSGLQSALDGKAATVHVHDPASTSVAGFMSATDKTKLNGIATAATANATDAQLRDRATHTGAQAISTVTGLQTALNTKVEVVGSAVNRISDPNHPRPAGAVQCIWFVTEGLFPTNAAIGDDIDDGTDPFNPDVIQVLTQDVVELEARVGDIEATRLRTWVGTLAQYNDLTTPRPTDTAYYILPDTP
jgi:hypothetical protein